MLGSLKQDPDVNCGDGISLWEGLLCGGPDLWLAHAGEETRGPGYVETPLTLPAVSLNYTELFFFFWWVVVVDFWLVHEYKAFSSLPIWGWRDALGWMKWAVCPSEKDRAGFCIRLGEATLNHYLFCSMAVEQTGMLFPCATPKLLSLRATAILGHFTSSLQSPPSTEPQHCSLGWCSPETWWHQQESKVRTFRKHNDFWVSCFQLLWAVGLWTEGQTGIFGTAQSWVATVSTQDLEDQGRNTPAGLLQGLNGMENEGEQ